ncbi:unnamed protein product [Paramecium sonneborni]|uniref:Uncharacterized protein n=1 Tax=Paramecium sonneborni TaxID=65129 RepID=A0A8S1QQI3_9CILI|nr:unnamed protein product [Paramecium sonneborni]
MLMNIIKTFRFSQFKIKIDHIQHHKYGPLQVIDFKLLNIHQKTSLKDIYYSYMSIQNCMRCNNKKKRWNKQKEPIQGFCQKDQKIQMQWLKRNQKMQDFQLIIILDFLLLKVLEDQK